MIDLSEVDEPNILAGPTWESHGPGTDRFQSLLQSVQTSANRVGQNVMGVLLLRNLPYELVWARVKLELAHRLLLDAHGTLLQAHRLALRKKSEHP